MHDFNVLNKKLHEKTVFLKILPINFILLIKKHSF